MGGCAGNKQPKPEEKEKPETGKQPKPLNKAPDSAAPAPLKKLTQSEYFISHLESITSVTR